MNSKVLLGVLFLSGSLLQAELVFYPDLEKIIPADLMLEMTRLCCPESLLNDELMHDIKINTEKMAVLFENSQLIDQVTNKSVQWKSDCKKLMKFIKKATPEDHNNLNKLAEKIAEYDKLLAQCYAIYDLMAQSCKPNKTVKFKDFMKRAEAHLKNCKNPVALILLKDIKTNKIVYPDGSFYSAIFE